MRETRSKVIEGETYEVNQLGAVRGSKVFVRCLNIMGPALASKDMSAVFSVIKEDDIEYLCNVFAGTTVVGGKPLDKILDLHFAGHYMAMVQWLWFCIEVNFGDFFKGRVGEKLQSLTGEPAPTAK